MESLDGVVLAAFDAEKDEGKELAEQYLVQGYPTFVLTDAAGEILDTWSGYGKEHFVEQLGESLKDPITMDAKIERFAKAPTVEDGMRIARYRATRGDYLGGLEMLAGTEKLDGAPDVAATRFDYTFSAFTRAEELSVDHVRKAADAVVASSEAAPNNLVEVAEMMAYLGRKQDNPALGVPYLEPAMAATADAEDEGLRRAYAGFAVTHALLVEKDASKAVRLKYDTMPEGWKDDVSQLNGFTWWCFENKVNLKEAEILGRRGIDLAAPGKERAMILDTTAEICNARGNCDDAVELIQQAIADHPDSEFYPKQLKRFEEIRATSQAN